MATTLQGALAVTLNVLLRDAGTLSVLDDRLATGAGGFAALSKALTDGTTANKAQRLFYSQYTTAGGANNDLDLTSLTDRRNVSLSFSAVRWFFLRLTAPAAGAYLLAQPHATNGWAAWFGGTSPTEEVRDFVLRVNQIDSWAVSGTSKVLRINNPTGSSITYDLALVGH